MKLYHEIASINQYVYSVYVFFPLMNYDRDA